MKPGLLTSELWLAVATIIAAATGEPSSNPNVQTATMVVAGIYILARTYLKAKVPSVPGASAGTALKQIFATLFAPGVPVTPAPVAPPQASAAAAAKPAIE